MSIDANPFRRLERQFERMQRQLEETMNQWGPERFGMPEWGTTSMGVDLADHGDEFVLTADVPGFERDDITLRLQGDALRITAERSEETEDRDELYLKRERARRSISRSITLPDPVDEDGVEARYNNGVLTVTLPKAEPAAAEGRTIEIE